MNLEERIVKVFLWTESVYPTFEYQGVSNLSHLFWKPISTHVDSL